MKSQKGFSLIEILITLIILAILAGGVWVWQNQKVAKVTPRVLPTPILVNQMTPNPVEVTAWRTYTNNQYKFVLQYPQDFSIEDTTQPLKQVYQRDKVPRDLLLRQTLSKNKTKIHVSVYKNDAGTNFDAWDAQLGGASFGLCLPSDNEVVSDQTVMIDGRIGRQGVQLGMFGLTLTVAVDGPKNNEVRYIYMLELDPQSECKISPQGEANGREDCQTFNQILPTFKFLD